MPSTPVLSMEAANLFCGKGASTSASTHLVLTQVKLPSFDINYVDHRPGGAPVGVEIDTICNHLECTFVTLGLQPGILSMLRSLSFDDHYFEFYGVLRDQIEGSLWQAVARMTGQLARADPTPFDKGDVLHTQYSIRGMTHYELNVAGQEVYFWDFAQNIFRTGSPTFAPTFG